MVVASHQSYPRARQEADSLIMHGFPPDRLSVVVRELRLVKRRLTIGLYVRRALRWGLLVGAFGALLGLWIGRGVLSQPFRIALVSAAGGAVALAVIGVVSGVVVEGLRARLGRETGVDILEADGYDVAVDEPLAEAARRLLWALHHGSDEKGSPLPSSRPRSDPARGAAAEDNSIDRGGQQH